MLGTGPSRSLPLVGSWTKCAGSAAPWSPYTAADAATPLEPPGLRELPELMNGKPVRAKAARRGHDAAARGGRGVSVDGECHAVPRIPRIHRRTCDGAGKGTHRHSRVHALDCYHRRRLHPTKVGIPLSAPRAVRGVGAPKRSFLRGRRKARLRHREDVDAYHDVVPQRVNRTSDLRLITCISLGDVVSR